MVNVNLHSDSPKQNQKPPLRKGMILDLRTVPHMAGRRTSVETDSSGCDAVSRRRRSSTASANSEFSEEYERIKIEQQNQIIEEQHRTRTMQRRAEILSLRNCPADMTEVHRKSSSYPGPKPTRTLREMLLELGIDIDSSHGRYRKRSIDRRLALNAIVHPPFEAIPESDNACANTAPELPPAPVSWPKRHSVIIRDLSIFGGSDSPREVVSAPIDGQLLRGKQRSPSLTLFRKVKGVDEIYKYKNVEPRKAEPIANMVRQSSDNLTKQFTSVRNMFTKNAEFDEDDPIRNNILLATMERRQSNNLLNALKNFDADEN